jgi:GPH family glycoside/pentoside/hexuronide:cation symporter
VVSTYLLYFLVDVALIGSWLAGLIYIIAYGIWNALNDPIVGFVSDKTRTRWGRRKPYIFVGAVFSLIFYILMWGPPAGLSSLNTFLYLLIVIIAYEFFYSMSAVTWFAVYPEIWQDVEDRSQVVIFRQVFAIVGGTFAGGVFPFLQVTLSSTVGEIPSWMIASAILGGLFSLTFLVSLLGIHERKEFEKDQQLTVKEAFKKNLHSKPLLTYMGIHTMTFAMAGWQAAMAPFLIVHSLGYGLEMTTLLMIPTMFLTVACFPIWKKIYMRLGPKRAVGTAAVTNILCYIPVLFINGIFLLLLWGALLGFATSGILVTREIMVADVCDADECATGTRNEGSIFGFTKMASRASMVLVGLFNAILLDVIIGYNPSLPDPPMMDLYIRIGIVVVTLLFTIVLLTFLKLYPLDIDQVLEIREELNELHAKKLEKVNKS